MTNKYEPKVGDWAYIRIKGDQVMRGQIVEILEDPKGWGCPYRFKNIDGDVYNCVRSQLYKTAQEAFDFKE